MWRCELTWWFDMCSALHVDNDVWVEVQTNPSTLNVFAHSAAKSLSTFRSALTRTTRNSLRNSLNSDARFPHEICLSCLWSTGPKFTFDSFLENYADSPVGFSSDYLPVLSIVVPGFLIKCMIDHCGCNTGTLRSVKVLNKIPTESAESYGGTITPSQVVLGITLYVGFSVEPSERVLGRAFIKGSSIGFSYGDKPESPFISKSVDQWHLPYP